MGTHWTKHVESREETFEFAESVTGALDRGDVLGLSGPLGAGKTVFVKGMANKLGMEDPWQDLTSPTYTLQNIYQLKETLIHCDAYRLQNTNQFHTLGWTEQFSEGITAIEWVDRFLPEIRPYLTAQVQIDILDENAREITIKPKDNELETKFSDAAMDRSTTS